MQLYNIDVNIHVRYTFLRHSAKNFFLITAGPENTAGRPLRAFPLQKKFKTVILNLLQVFCFEAVLHNNAYKSIVGLHHFGV